MKPIALWICVAWVVSACSFRTETQEVVPPPPTATRVVYVPQPDPPREVVYIPPDSVSPSRDEYGFRYDAKGNRIDRYGNIISPHSTYRD